MELLQTYNLLEESIEDEDEENIESAAVVDEDNIVIDITASRENLVENFEQSVNKTLESTILLDSSNNSNVPPVLKENSAKTSKFTFVCFYNMELYINNN